MVRLARLGGREEFRERATARWVSEWRRVAGGRGKSLCRRRVILLPETGVKATMKRKFARWLAVAVGIGSLDGCAPEAAGPGERAAKATAAAPVVKPPGPAAARPAALEDLPSPENPAKARTEAAVPVGRVSRIDLAAFFALRETGQAVVYDVRPPLFYNLGHISGAVSFPGKAFERLYPQEKPKMEAAVGRGQTVVLYCTDLKCPDAGVVARWLAELGHSVTIYTGGWEEWKNAGLPKE